MIPKVFFADAVAHNRPYMYSRLMQAWRYVSSYFTSSVTIECDDHAFNALEQWLSGRTIFNDATSFRAHSKFEKKSIGGSGERGWDDEDVAEDPSTHTFEYEPRCAHKCMLYNNKIIFVKQHSGSNGSITLSCLGRSAGAVKEILSEASDIYTASGSLVTVIRRADGGSWSQSSSKPQRSVDSVSIDTTQKTELLDDMDDYVRLKTAAWYAARGIPYRRGYIFFGPPGTGKTSLASALAARYKRDIYVIPLRDKYMDDSRLLHLLNGVPNRSIVLFEDIDSAGLARELVDDSAEFAQTHVMVPKHPPVTAVTLSGLLNAIDGVEAPEGHILIMTTNKIENLDEALIRSGRISQRIEFRLTSPAQATEIFIRMMQEEVYVAAQQADTPEAQKLAQLARKFAQKIPDNTFSPADLQDFLIGFKSAPERAVQEVEAWKARKLAERDEYEKAKLRELEKQRKREEEEFRKALQFREDEKKRNERLKRDWADKKAAAEKESSDDGSSDGAGADAEATATESHRSKTCHVM